jgi:hypothetical protein
MKKKAKEVYQELKKVALERRRRETPCGKGG